ncbi:hypothetical protein [Fulvivirga lutimaris]|uniref:hypothetical protein n=1 Tax=Fulvivirga lutimaris TaxID=1819566 RepID=UPI0012BD2E79|nr:hypothetical protein [Fulvivirga lutimaris]MTI39440.1 hypothetical protein [Fulvivirga lutimaris]
MNTAILSISLWLILWQGTVSFSQPSYLTYHNEVIEIEQLIVDHKFEAALEQYTQLFDSYDFVFLKEYKVAAQLAILTNNNTLATDYLKSGIKGGWTPKAIKKNKLVRPLLDALSKVEITHLIEDYQKTLNQPLRNQAHEMFKKDQKMAFKALFKIGQKAKNRYNEEKFAPHSEQQIAHLIKILNSSGYPGERLIGNDFWLSTVLSHHNSISSAYNKADTLFDYSRPKLLKAIDNGQMSPIEFVLAEDWKVASESNHGQAAYGFLGPTLNIETARKANNMRKKIGLRSVELRNQLIDIEEETGINLYLPRNPWQDGKIEIVDN